jgi:hypothetical protein
MRDERTTDCVVKLQSDFVTLMAMFGFNLEMRREYHLETPIDTAVGKVKKQHETLKLNI